ncbi:hypothetical protein MKX07_001834, partial [Trichoderma sp. CBMAI-0711]
ADSPDEAIELLSHGTASRSAWTQPLKPIQPLSQMSPDPWQWRRETWRISQQTCQWHYSTVLTRKGCARDEASWRRLLVGGIWRIDGSRAAEGCQSVGCRLATQSREGSEEQLCSNWVAALAALATLAARLAVGRELFRLARRTAHSSRAGRGPFSRFALICLVSTFVHRLHGINGTAGASLARNQAQNLALGRQLSDQDQSRIEGNLGQGSDGQPQKEQAAGQCGSRFVTSFDQMPSWR